MFYSYKVKGILFEENFTYLPSIKDLKRLLKMASENLLKKKTLDSRIFKKISKKITRVPIEGFTRTCVQRRSSLHKDP